VPYLCDCIELPSDLRGRRVLDAGAWNGCFSFECERRGADDVVALSLEDPDASGFSRLKHLLKSRVQYVRQSIYTIDRADLGEFDLILFLGVLYHLRYPLLAIDKLRTVSRGRVLVESHVIDEHVEVPGWFGPRRTTLRRLNRRLPGLPLWRFYKDDELNHDRSNWFGPNIRAVCDAFESAGFDIRLLRQWGDRASFEATARRELPEALTGTYEAIG
jgi:tRNA (mo5U34)-methyltransferase